MNNHFNNQKGGFIQIVIFIIIALIILKFLNLTISDVVYYFKTFFADVFR